MKQFVVICLIFFSEFCFSQVVNIENKRIYDDTAGWSGALDAGFSAVQNKDLLLNANFRPRVQYKTPKHYYLFLTDWYYSKGADRVYANTGMAHFRYAYRLQGKNATKKSPWIKKDIESLREHLHFLNTRIFSHQLKSLKVIVGATTFHGILIQNQHFLSLR